ncbi:hypothetical protein QBC34DRAFT_475969 [Podospora aff. communis PSN243]|uniref:AA1-like domain-containing protein n=1 Tax=Podospora aff. communis PSN243 TaxID=3040156 RepID=A0AAV9G7M1_9PEZI|nr:hypothetical protein QBC34DRAFT_475969 [Podospora aff. communis PSN243]
MLVLSILAALLSLVAAAPHHDGGPPADPACHGDKMPSSLKPRQSQTCVDRSLKDFYWLMSIDYSGIVQIASPSNNTFPSQANITFTALNSATGTTTACTFNDTQFTTLVGYQAIECYALPSLPTYPGMTYFALSRNYPWYNTSETSTVSVAQSWVCDDQTGTPTTFFASYETSFNVPYTASTQQNSDWQFGEVYLTQEESLSISKVVVNPSSVETMELPTQAP